MWLVQNRELESLASSRMFQPMRQAVRAEKEAGPGAETRADRLSPREGL